MISDIELFETPYSEKTFDQLSRIKNHTELTLRDYFISLHFIDDEILNAKSVTEPAIIGKNNFMRIIQVWTTILQYGYNNNNIESVPISKYNHNGNTWFLECVQDKLLIKLSEHSGITLYFPKINKDTITSFFGTSTHAVMSMYSEDINIQSKYINNRPGLTIQIDDGYCEYFYKLLSNNLSDEMKCWLLLNEIDISEILKSFNKNEKGDEE